MTFIDWSDPEEMIGLLSEYVVDARNEERADPERAAALGTLLEDLTGLIRGADPVSLDTKIAGLRRIHAMHFDDLGDDPVLRHVEDCIVELERIRGEGDR